jgi:uncharacterized membrane protein
MILRSLSLLVAVSKVINILLILYKFLDNIYDMVIHTDALLQKKVCIYIIIQEHGAYKHKKNSLFLFIFFLSEKLQ